MTRDREQGLHRARNTRKLMSDEDAMKRFLTALAIVFAVLLLVGVGAYVYMRTAMNGFSARAEPSRT